MQFLAYFEWIVAAMAFLAVIDIKRYQAAHGLSARTLLSGAREQRGPRISLIIRIVTYVLCISALIWFGRDLGYIAI